MFAVIYQSYVQEDREIEFQQLWQIVASYFVNHRGALGSCLHRSEDGRWLAYSRWPDKATRDASWPREDKPSLELPREIQQAILGIKGCIDEKRKLPEICMDVVQDLLLAPMTKTPSSLSSRPYPYKG